jgi:hypothetical protein
MSALNVDVCVSFMARPLNDATGRRSAEPVARLYSSECWTELSR